MRMSGSPYWTGGGASGNPTHALFADRSHSFPDQVVALFGYIRAWSCSAEPARSAVGEYSSIRLKDWSGVLPCCRCFSAQPCRREGSKGRKIQTQADAYPAPEARGPAVIGNIRHLQHGGVYRRVAADLLVLA